MTQPHVGVAVECGFVQVLWLCVKMLLHQRQSLFALLLGGIVHAYFAQTHVKRDGSVGRVNLVGISQQVVERVQVVVQLLALCLHEDVLCLALVGRADSFLARCLLLARKGRHRQHRYHYNR